MDERSWNLSEALRAKDDRRRRLAALSYKEKVKIVVELQKMAAPLLLAQGKKITVWKLDE